MLSIIICDLGSEVHTDDRYGVRSHSWSEIKYSTTNEQVITKIYKVPAGFLVKLYGCLGDARLYIYSNGGTVKWALTGETAGYITSVTGVQFTMPHSTLSLELEGSGCYAIFVNSGSVTLDKLRE